MLVGPANFRSVCPEAASHLAPGRLYRTSAISWLTRADAGALGQAGLGAYLDLREDREIRDIGPPEALLAAGIAWLRLPLGPYDRSIVSYGCPQPEDFLASYFSMAEMCAPRLAEALDAIAANCAAPIAVGCSAGKDRTGVVVGLLLELLGVPRQLIARDYAASGPALLERLDDFAAHWRKRGIDRDAYAARFALQPGTMLDFLDGLDCRYGGTLALLEDGGLAPAAVRRLRRSLSRHPPPVRQHRG